MLSLGGKSHRKIKTPICRGHYLFVNTFEPKTSKVMSGVITVNTRICDVLSIAFRSQIAFSEIRDRLFQMGKRSEKWSQLPLASRVSESMERLSNLAINGVRVRKKHEKADAVVRGETRKFP